MTSELPLDHVFQKIPEDLNTDQGEDNLGYTADDTNDSVHPEEGLDIEEYKDEGYIELVLRVMAMMCDGQFQGLQAR